MKLYELAAIILLPLQVFAFSSLDEQVSFYQSAFGNPTSNFELLSKKSSLFAGLEKPKTGLKGVFYWGGTDKSQSHGQSSLTNSTAANFCQNGFSHLFYVYKKNVGPSSVSCGKGTIPYDVSGQVNGNANSAMVRKFMETLYGIIKSNGQKGPVYLHCWWGIHASNTFASIALKQFCGYSSEDAVEHWNKIGHYPDPNNKALDAKSKEENRQKIRNFNPYSDLQISEEERSAICF